MQKGYSKEIMEALFKQEEQRLEQDAQKQKKQLSDSRQEILQMQVEKLLEETDKLQKQVKWLRIGLTVCAVIALIAMAMSFNAAIKEFLILLP